MCCNFNEGVQEYYFTSSIAGHCQNTTRPFSHKVSGKTVNERGN